MKNLTKLSLAVASLSLLSGSSFADTNLSVTATVADVCTFSASPTIGLGTYTAAADSTTINSNVAATCTNQAAYNIATDVGVGTNASYTNRILTGTTSTNMLNYNLYLGATQVTVWGDGTGATSQLSDTGVGTSQVLSFNASIPSGQTTAQADSYSDTVGMTVTFDA